MTVPDDATTATLLGVIQTLDAALKTEREAATKAREEAKREIAKLVAMVEGLTKQLDLLLRDRDEERRADLVRVREEARALAEAAAAAAGTATGVRGQAM